MKITREIASRYGGEHAKAWHTNSVLCVNPSFSLTLLLIKYILSTRPLPDDDMTSYTPSEREGLARLTTWERFESGYFKQQSTRPQTLGYSLADSPVGLLAWIYEKLVAWSDGYSWQDDEGDT